MNPKEIINDLPFEECTVAVDLGCGSGGWTVPLAKRLTGGAVYAIDVLEEPLSALKGKLKRESVPNVKIIKEDLETGVSVPDNRADLILMTNLLFQLEDKEKPFSEAKRILRKSGFILITDWLPDSPIGPKEIKISPEEVKGLATDYGFALKEEFQSGMHHYGFLYQK